MKEVLNLFISVAGQPAILVALIAILGLILQRKSFSDTLQGGIKTFVGFLVLTGGAGIISTSLNPMAEMFKATLHVQGVVPSNEAVVAIALQKFGTPTALIMLVGMIVNILIARYTRFKYVFLTGQVMLYMSCLTAVVMLTAGFKMNVWMILLGGLFEGTLLSVTPALCQPFMKNITGGDDVAQGHSGNIGYALSGLIGRWFGDKSKSTEDMKVSQSWGFLRDSNVAIALVMMIVYLVLALFTGPAFIDKHLSGGTNYVVYSITQAGTFAAGMYVVLAGVRLILGEIIPAFQGIAQKLVPNSKPALDVPIVFPFAPNAVIIGFLSSFIAGTLSMFVMVALHTVVIIPGVVGHFFCGAAAGVYGNAEGGRRGAIIGSFVQGIAISFLPMLVLPVLGSLKLASSTFADTDYLISGITMGNIGQLGTMAVTFSILAFFAIVVLYSVIRNSIDKSNHKTTVAGTKN